MPAVNQTQEFKEWLEALSDRVAKSKILVRIQRLEAGNPGDVNSVGDGISEMKIDHGPGYRVYFKKTGQEILLILCGGDKSNQKKDIERAKELAT